MKDLSTLPGEHHSKRAWQASELSLEEVKKNVARERNGSCCANDAINLIFQRLGLRSENRSRDMVNQNEFQPRLRLLLLWLKVDGNHIGEVDIGIVRPVLSLDKIHFIHIHLHSSEILSSP
jgi:hypothetical protein